MADLFMVRKNPGSSQNPWLAELKGKVIYRKVAELLVAGGVPKVFHSPKEAVDYIQMYCGGGPGTRQLNSVEETPDGIKFTPVPWPS